jgi:peptide/nickel transport system permease protein
MTTGISDVERGQAISRTVSVPENRLTAVLRAGLRRFPTPPLVSAALLYLGVIAVVGLLAGWLAPFGYDDQNLALRLQPPVFFGGSAEHWLGTDELGRDIFSRLLFSIRISLATALVGTLMSACIGTFVGFLAPRFGGLLDQTLMMLVDAQASVPFLIIALAALAFFGNSFVLFALLLGRNGWETYARVARGLVLSTHTLPYIEAVRLLGARPWRIYSRHVLPSVAGILVVKVTLNFPGTILLESGLSFLGLGIQPPLTSLGSCWVRGVNFCSSLGGSPWSLALRSSSRHCR